MFQPSKAHPELRFKAVRSSGKGGQHVNKVSTSVELYFNAEQSRVLNEDQKRFSGLKPFICKFPELFPHFKSNMTFTSLRIIPELRLMNFSEKQFKYS